MVVAAWLLVFTVIFAVSVSIALLATSGPGPKVILLVVYLFLVVLVVVGWRQLQVGVSVSDRGLRIRRLARTRTLPWAAIDEVHSRPARRFGRETYRQAIWVLPHVGPAVETPVQLYGADVRGIRARYGRILPPQEYQETLHLLRRKAAAAHAG
jgi:hypothetical protein